MSVANLLEVRKERAVNILRLTQHLSWQISQLRPCETACLRCSQFPLPARAAIEMQHRHTAMGQKPTLLTRSVPQHRARFVNRYPCTCAAFVLSFSRCDSATSICNIVNAVVSTTESPKLDDGAARAGEVPHGRVVGHDPRALSVGALGDDSSPVLSLSLDSVSRPAIASVFCEGIRAS